MQPHPIIPAPPIANEPLPVRGKNFPVWIMLALLLTFCAARVEGQDDDYLNIYGIIEQADALNASGKTSQAHAKYIEAGQALMQFQRDNPTWNTKTVSYRLNYLTDQIAATSGRAVAPENTGTAAVKQSTASAPKSPVKLLDAGSEPRTILRLHPAVGDQQTLTMTMKTATTASVAGNDSPAAAMPPIMMTMTVDVKSISSDGEIAYTMTFGDTTLADDPTAAPATVAAMKSALAGLSGMTGTGRMTDHGVIKNLQMKLPPGGNPQLAQTLDQMKDSVSGSSTPLPDEAVGPGAKWEYKTRVKSQGMTIDQIADYELVSREGDRLTLRSTITQTAANQTIQSPTMPGMKMDLTKMTGTAGGTTTYDLAHLMPVAAALDEKVEIKMGLNIGQQKQSMDMNMDMNITFESK